MLTDFEPRPDLAGPSEDEQFDQSVREPLTETHINVDAAAAAAEDFVTDELKRKEARKLHINTLLQQKAQRQTAHNRAIASQQELHEHAQEKTDVLLRALGYEPAIDLPENAKIISDAWRVRSEIADRGHTPLPRVKRAYHRKATTPAATSEPAKRRGRPPVTKNAAPAGDKPKRVVSEETKAKMRAAHAKRRKLLPKAKTAN